MSLQIKSLVKSEVTVQLYALAHSPSIKVGKAGKAYCDLTLCDQSGEIDAKIFSPTDDQITLIEMCKTKPTIVWVEGQTNEYNQQMQIIVRKIRFVENDEGVSLSNFIKWAPQPADEYLGVYKNALSKIQHPSLNLITRTLLNAHASELKHVPAAQKMHHNVAGGLIWHTSNMLQLCDTLLALYPNDLNPDLLRAACILHDLAKCQEFIIAEGTGKVSEYSLVGKLKGHIVMISEEVRETARMNGMDPSDEMIILLQHTILGHHGKREFGSPELPKTPEAIALAYIDLLDSRMGAVHRLLEATPKGTWSGRDYALETDLYHHPFVPGYPLDEENDRKV